MFQTEELTGTTIMAISYKDGVILGADTRTSMGNYIPNRITDKITKITPNIYCCRSGSSADTQAVCRVVKGLIEKYIYIEEYDSSVVGRSGSGSGNGGSGNNNSTNTPSTNSSTNTPHPHTNTPHTNNTNNTPVRTAAILCKNVIYKYKNLLASLIIAGYDNIEGGSVYVIGLGGYLIRREWALGGSGSPYIYGYVDKMYRNDFTFEERVMFVKECVSMAIGRDTSSGGCVRIMVISKEGIKRYYSE
ncbi:Proteasome subunit beta type-1 [Hamiltosporidium tvaerminnensis]|nr:Proteasome subunit beta type-1 [Hamiltosporidium tvaerminnensis]